MTSPKRSSPNAAWTAPMTGPKMLQKGTLRFVDAGASLPACIVSKKFKPWLLTVVRGHHLDWKPGDRSGRAVYTGSSILPAWPRRLGWEELYIFVTIK